MDEEQIKEQVRLQFAKHAERYVTSARHAGGSDLAFMVSSASATDDMLLLDIATGAGHVANAFAPLVRQVTACDLTPQMLRTAEQFIQKNGHSNVQFVVDDAEHLSFADASYDLITCRIAAHHFSNVPAFIAEAFRVVKPNGRLLLIDNVASENQDIDTFYNEIEKIRDSSHVRAWKKSEWLRFIEDAGFYFKAMVRFPKPFIFQDWCDRVELPDEKRIELQEKLLSAPSQVKNRLNIQYDENGCLYSFQGESVYLEAVKLLD